MRSQAGVNGSAGGWFWGLLLGIGILFWPSIFVHGPGKVPAEIAWYSFVILLSLVIVLAASWQPGPRRPRPKTGVPLTPPPTTGPWPDLRQSDVFEGKME